MIGTAVHIKPVPGYEGSYEVTEHGDVISLKRGQRKTLVPVWTGRYYVVTLYGNGGRTRYEVHRLICSAFSENPGRLPLVRHLNGNSRDNRAVNLAWSDNSENMRDRRRHGTDFNCQKTHCPAGHEYTEENTAVWYRRGDPNLPSRKCRECSRVRDRARKSRK